MKLSTVDFFDDRGSKIPGNGGLNSFENLVNYSRSTFELVENQSIVIYPKGRE